MYRFFYKLKVTIVIAHNMILELPTALRTVFFVFLSIYTNYSILALSFYLTYVNLLNI